MKHRTDTGFTLIEVLVGVLVGAIVMTCAIAVLVSTNRAGAKLLSKQEVSQSTRVALTQILKSLGSGQSMLRCAVWSDSDTQNEYNDYLADEGSVTSFDPDECLEYYENGTVVVFALNNTVCWNKDVTPGDTSEVDFSRPPRMECLFRGGAGSFATYDGDGNNIGSSVPMPCTDLTDGTQDDLLYYAECQVDDAGFNYFTSPKDVTNEDWRVVDDTKREVIDLVNEVPDSLARKHRKNIFSYTKVTGGTPNLEDGTDISDIEFVDVNIGVTYFTGNTAHDGNKETAVYRFSQTVLLQGMKAYSDQGAYGDRFVGG